MSSATWGTDESETKKLTAMLPYTGSCSVRSASWSAQENRLSPPRTRLEPAIISAI